MTFTVKQQLHAHLMFLLTAESAVDNLDDELSVKFIQEIMDWCGSHPVLSRVSDTSKVYLCGHSRVWLAVLQLIETAQPGQRCIVDNLSTCFVCTCAAITPVTKATTRNA